MISMNPIGTIHTPFTTIKNMPIQPKGAVGIQGEIHVNAEFVDGLVDLDGFSHIYLIYHFHQAGATQLQVTPFLDVEPRGVFSTRSPLRPNPIGISLVELQRVEQNILYVSGVDMLNGTPLLDIKPFIEKFDTVSQSSSGWMQANKREIAEKRSDERFK